MKMTTLKKMDAMIETFNRRWAKAIEDAAIFKDAANEILALKLALMEMANEMEKLGQPVEEEPVEIPLRPERCQICEKQAPLACIQTEPTKAQWLCSVCDGLLHEEE